MKIVIVGGGTAGWITAAFLKKNTNYSDITLIESPNIPIIGAGEGSTGTLPHFIKEKWPDNSITEIDFLSKTKGTLKLGINLKNWKGDGTQIYSPFDSSTTSTSHIDSALYGSCLKYNRADYSSLHSWLMDNKLTTFRNEYGRIKPGLDNHSYHFDGVEVGKFFKKWCTDRGVKLIVSDVIDTVFNENEELKNVKLDTGEIVDSDLWFDCSGFSRTLMSKTKNKWVSYKDYLPCNSAIPFSTPIHPKEVKFETLAEAMNSGWMWKIPLQYRHGCGYVYCDSFQTYEQSLNELNKKLGSKIEPIKHIKFESGRYDKVWYKNIVAIGLSSHFLEPLQATSIHIALVSLTHLLTNYVKGNTLHYNCDYVNYNNTISDVIDDYKDFIQMHYLTGREDTPFWKFVTNEMKITDKNLELIEASKYRILTRLDIKNTHGAPGYSLWSHILDNSGYYDRELLKKELLHFGKDKEAFNEIENLKKFFEKIKPELVSNEDFFKYLKI
jgi:tryptophan halogenase